MVAKYALCGTADDIVQNLPGTDRHVWMQYSMLAQFFQVRTSGVGFFEELKKILANPAPRYDLLELMHACLSLGFEGQYRGAAGGDVQRLQRWRRDVYQTLRHLRTRSDDDISPRWQGMAKLMKNVGAVVPAWVIAGVAGAALVGVYFLLRFIISADGEALAARLTALNPAEAVTIERAAFVPFAGPDLTSTTQLQRIRTALDEDIKGGGLDVVSVGDNIVVQVNNLLLFASGRADVQARVRAGRSQDRGRARQGTGSDQCHRPHRQCEAEAVERLQVELRSVRGARQVGGEDHWTEDSPIPGASASRSRRGRTDRRQQDPEGRTKNSRVEVMIPRAEE